MTGDPGFARLWKDSKMILFKKKNSMMTHVWVLVLTEKLNDTIQDPEVNIVEENAKHHQSAYTISFPSDLTYCELKQRNN